MPALENWVLIALGVTTVVVVLAAVATIRGSAVTRQRHRSTAPVRREDDLRGLAARLAGPVGDAFASLTTMETLANQQPTYRPAVVALLAEHLRKWSDCGDDAVTQAVQHSLANHLRAQTRGPRAGSPLHLDLAGAQLRELDLSGLSLTGLSLAGARLTGTARLTGLRCSEAIEAAAVICEGDLAAADLYVGGSLRLEYSLLGNLDLSGAFVQGITDLAGAQVTGSAWLTGAVLPAIRLYATSGAGTESASFSGPVDLQGLMSDDFRLRGTEFAGGLTLTVNQDRGISRQVSSADPDMALLVRRAVFYEAGSAGQVEHRG